MILVLDTETTGREPPEVIEMAYNVLDPENDWRFDHSNLYRFQPKQGSTTGALAVHHILDPELDLSAPSETAELPEGTDYIIGHNVDYDWKVLGQPDVKRICTLALSRWLWPLADAHTLGAMCYFLWPHADAKQMLTVPGNAGFGLHSAQFDADLCTSIFHRILQELNERSSAGEQLPWTPFSIWEVSEKARIPTVMAFGKHKGMKIKDLPWGYKQWMLKQEDMDSYLLRAVRDSM